MVLLNIIWCFEDVAENLIRYDCRTQVGKIRFFKFERFSIMLWTKRCDIMISKLQGNG